MGSFFCDLLSFSHDVGIYDADPSRLRFSYNCRRFLSLDEVDEFDPDMVINAATVRYTIEAFEAVLPHLRPGAILSDIASVKNGLPEFYSGCGHPYVSTHPMLYNLGENNFMENVFDIMFFHCCLQSVSQPYKHYIKQTF